MCFCSISKKKDSFKLIDKSIMPIVQYIPVLKEYREKFYEEIDFKVPKYEEFSKIKNPEDLVVLHEDYFIEFMFNNKRYRATFKKGFVFDVSSVPLFLVHGSVSKHNQHTIEASMIHDVVVEFKLLSYEDCGTLYSAMIESLGGKIGKGSDIRYLIGVRNPIARYLYKRKTRKCRWYEGYFTFEELSLDEE